MANLVDTYLAEIAPDANLTVDKFIALSELLPDHARALDDGLYRAIDIFLKVPLLVSICSLITLGINLLQTPNKTFGGRFELPKTLIARI